MKKKNRKHSFTAYAAKLRLIAFVLVWVLLLSVVPPISLAAEEKVTATEQSLSQEETEQVYTYTEITDMRDSFTKHFRRSDGKIVAIVYPEVMHTEKDGEMVDVDNRLSYSKSLGAYRTANDEFAVSFAPSASADSTVGITFEGYSLSWRVDVVRNPLNTSDQTIATKQMALREVKQERASLASVASVESQAFEAIDTKTTFLKEEITSSFASTSALHYKNAFTGTGSVDLRYTVSHNRVEEDIVINEKSDIRSYVMQITAPDLTAVLSEDDSVSFFNDNGDSIFTIGAPWMYDAADEFSIDIEVSLVQDGDSVTVVYTPDSTWLNAKERVYPVVIDPSVKSRNYTSNYVDAYVYTGTTVNDRILTLGYTKSGINSDGKVFDTYTTFNSFPALFAPMQIESATMTYYASSSRTEQKMRILNKQNDSKSGAKMNWATDIYNFSFDNRPLGMGTIYEPTVTPVESGAYAYTYDFTQAIDDYEYSYGSASTFFTDYFNGFRVYGISTTTQSLNYYSSESASANYRPVLEITYSYEPDIPIRESGVYQIQNRNSSKRMMIPNSTSSTNVFQFNTANSSLQAFLFDGADGIYTIRPYSRSSEALTWDYSGSSVQNATNVYLSSATTAKADKQEFIVRYVTDGTDGYHYYAILSRADTRMALTAYGTGAGSTTGTSTTSSGNVYMSEYTGANSQLWCLYSGGMPVFLGNDIRAENGTMYEYDLGISDVWLQPYCYVTEFGDTVSFSSSDSTAIGVASNGKVTAKNAGRVTLTATVKNSAGTVKNTYSYTVTLKLQNGVYYIKNESSGLYLDATGTSLAEGADVVQSSKIETGDARFGQLWRIHYLGDNLYSIRSMRKLDMGLKAVSGNVDLYTIGTTDTRTGISDAAEWNFKSSNSYGYRIQQSGSSGLTLEQSGNGFAVGAYNGYVREFWRFEKVNVTPGIYVFNMVEDVSISTTHQFSAIHYSENLTSQNIQWSSSNEAVAIIDEDTGLLTPLKRGTTEITVQEGNISKTFEVQIVKKAIIIVPGLMGCDLYDASTGAPVFESQQLNNLIAFAEDADSSIDINDVLSGIRQLSKLECKENGVSKKELVFSTEYNNNNNETQDDYYGMWETYKPLFTALKQKMQSESKDYSIEFFAYDWRMSNEYTALQLRSFIANGGYGNNSLNGFDYVVLVGHSMGGLVISSYLAFGENERNKVENCFFLGSPLLGTPVAPYMLFTDDLSEVIPGLDLDYLYDYYVYYQALGWIFDNLATIQELLINMPSLYELFPTTKYFDTAYGDSSYLKYDEDDDGDYEICSTYDATRRCLIKTNTWLDEINTNLLSNAESFHQSLYVNGEHISNLVSSYYISSYNVETINFMKMNDDYEIVDAEKAMYGDRMVPVKSASLGDKYEENTFFVDGIDHTSMVERTKLNEDDGYGVSDLVTFIYNMMFNGVSPDTDTILEECPNYGGGQQ